MKTKIKLLPSIFRVFKSYRPAIWWLIVILIFSFFSYFLLLVSPIILERITADIFLAFDKNSSSYGHFDDLWNQICFNSILFIVLVVGSGLFDTINNYLIHFLGKKITFILRSELNRKTHHLPLSYFDQVDTGNIIAAVANDATYIQDRFVPETIWFASNVMFILFTIAGMFYISWTYASIVSTIVIIVFSILIIIIKFTNHYYRQSTQDNANFTTLINETYTGNAIVKSFNLNQIFQKKFNLANKALYKSSKKAKLYSSIISPILLSAVYIGEITLCVLGTVWAIRDHNMQFITVIPSFLVYVGLINLSLANLSTQFEAIQLGASYFNHIETILAIPNEKFKSKNLVIPRQQFKGNVEFNNVTFAYGKKNVINNLSFKIQSGQKVAIVGHTGGGKTTITKLLMRFYDPNSGVIKIDGYNISDLNVNYLRSLYAVVSQEAWIFNGTIRQNIVYQQKKITQKHLENICRAINLHNFIASLPKGYDTIINDYASISEGQKQLICIARIMLINPHMVILDEATSNIDTITELQVEKAFSKLIKGKTTFVIAHRLSTIKNADLILVIDHGQLVESGTHDELLKNKQKYYKLYLSQFNDSEAN